jgi:hypothetical protein
MSERNNVLSVAIQLQSKAAEGALHATTEAMVAMMGNNNARYQMMLDEARAFADVFEAAGRVIEQHREIRVMPWVVAEVNHE